jgi:U4/U6.U5 tri-snRNP-associated protein 1
VLLRRAGVRGAVGLAFTEAAEFARGIHVAAPDEAPAEPGASHMGVDEADPNPTPAPPADPPKKPAAWGAWVAAGEGGEGGAAAAADADMPDAEAEEDDGAAAEDGSLVREKPVGSGARAPRANRPRHARVAGRVLVCGRLCGAAARAEQQPKPANGCSGAPARTGRRAGQRCCRRGQAACAGAQPPQRKLAARGGRAADWDRARAPGLAGALALLKERGDLAERVEWSGRINDMRRERMGDLTDVYTEGRHEERIAADIERALTERDEFGRVLTPRERFRRLCYRRAPARALSRRPAARSHASPARQLDEDGRAWRAWEEGLVLPGRTHVPACLRVGVRSGVACKAGECSPRAGRAPLRRACKRAARGPTRACA